jgi:DNA-binding winged-HTH domains
MSNVDRHFYEFEGFRLDVEKRVLWRNGEIVPVTPKAAEVLLALVEKHGDLLERDDLIERVWKDTFVEEANLNFTISNLRKVLGQNGRNYIQTVPRRGYRFSPLVTEKFESKAPDLIPIAPPPTLIETQDEQPVRRFTGDLTYAGPQAKNGKRWVYVGVALVIISLAALLGKLYFKSPSIEVSTSAAAPRTLAVMPLHTLSKEEDESAFGMGITESLISRLGNLPSLVIRPIGSVKKLTEQQTDPIEIGRVIKADAVLDGSYQRAGGRIRINVRLLNVADGSQIWSGNFDENDTEIFKLQDSLSNQIAQSLINKLSSSESQQLVTRLTNNKDAYDSYVRGRYFWNKRTGDSLYKAIDYLKEATELDPNFAEAYASLADSQYMLFDYNFEVSQETVERSRENLRAALSLKPDLPDALITQAAIQMTHDWDLAGAESSLKRAIEVAPNFATARQRYGSLLIRMGRFPEAMDEFNKAVELDPVSIVAVTNIGMVHFCKKDFAAADNQFRRAIETDDKFSTAHWMLSRSLWQEGRHDEAVAEIIRGLELDGNKILSQRIEQKALQGGAVEAIRLLLYEWRANPPGTNPHNLAYLSTYVDDREKAIYWLQRSLGEHHPWTLWVRSAPEFEPLQNDPRVQEILKKTNLQS